MTTTAIPSLDVGDFKENIQDFDQMANGTGTYADRFGKNRLTLDAFMAANGFEVPVAFASGIVVSRTTQTVTYNGNTYHALPSALPFTTTGTFNAAQWVLLRQNANNVTSATLTITGFTASALLDGAWIHFAGRDTVGDGGGGMFRYSASSTQTADGGTVFAPAGGGRLFRDGWTVLGFNGPVNAEWFGASATLSVNSADAIINALSAHKHVIVPPGEFRCDSMIEVQAFKTLELSGGTILRRAAASSASTDPVVWIKGSDASFIGKGQGVSTVITENRCPLGAVSLGHRDMTQSHGDVTYSTLLDMTISGSTPYGQTTGQPDVSLFMCNPQIGGKASYFHNVSGLRLQQANVGLWLLGWANGNTISNLQGYKLGNSTMPTANRNGFVLCSGALDNTFVGAFFHDSPNAVGLTVETVDNRSTPGGSLHEPYANKFSGLVCEQGGASALGVKIISGGGSYYEVRDNCAGGNSLYVGFYDNNNTFLQMAGITSSAVLCKNFTSTSESTHEQANIATERMLQGGAAFTARKVKMTGGSTANASLSFTLSHNAQASIWRTGSVLIKAQGGTRGSSSGSVAWYLYGASSLGTTYPTLGTLKDSGGDTGTFTITNPSNGVITIASSLNDIAVELEYIFTNANVNVA